MGFEGITMTDDLDMGAIESHFEVDTLVEKICEAEIDVALICQDQAKIEATYESLLKAVGDSLDTRRKRVLSVQRILSLKGRYPLRGGKPLPAGS
jgi:beta-N-acetylhexosaminidase